MAKNTLNVVVPEIQNAELEIDVVGATSLIVKDFDTKTLRAIEDAQQGVAKQKKQPRKPAEECERARVRNSAGKDCVKAIWFKKAMSSTAGFFGIPRGNIEQGVYVVGDLIPIKYSGNKPIMRSDRVRVGQGPQAKTSVAYRPEFRDWSCRLRIGFDASVITIHQVVSLLSHAGLKNGIGEWRPQKGGDFGRFQVFPAGASKKLLADVGRQTKQLAAGKAETEASAITKRKPGRPRKNAESAVVANKVVRRGRKGK